MVAHLPPDAPPSPEMTPSPDLADPFLVKLRLLLEQGLVSSAYRTLCALVPVEPSGPIAASPARRANVLALCGAVGTVELSLEHERWEEALEGIEVVDSLWEMADWLAGREGRSEHKGSREEKRCEWTCRALEGLERWDDLVDCSRKGGKLVPPLEMASSYLTVALYKLGQLHESSDAASGIRPGFDLPEHEDVITKMRAALDLVKLGNNALLVWKNFDLALEHFTEALQVDDDNIAMKLRLLRVRSTTYLRAGDPLSALDDVAKILELRPSDGDAFLTRARAYLALQHPREALVACAAARRYGNAGDGSSEKLEAEELLRKKEEAAKAREEEAVRQAKRAADEARRTADEARRAAEEARRAEDEAKKGARPEAGSSTRPPPTSGGPESGGGGQGPSGGAHGGGRGGPGAHGGYGGWQYGGGGGYGAGPQPGWNGGGRNGGGDGWYGAYGAGPQGGWGPGGWRNAYGAWTGPGGGPSEGWGEGWRKGGWSQGQWEQGGWGSYGGWYSSGWPPPGGGPRGAWHGGPGAGTRGPPPPPPRAEKDDLAPDHYATLELDRAASTADVRAAYLRLSLVAHPDKGGTHQLFVRLKAAYDVLVDPLARQRYDSGAV